MYSHLFSRLRLDEMHLMLYICSNLQGFNGTVTKPLGYIEMIANFRETETTRSVKLQFLVIDRHSLYQCILGRPALSELIVAPSMVHMKIKYYTSTGISRL